MEKINSRILQIADYYNIKKAADFSKKTGFSHQVASNYLKGTRVPNAEALAVIKQVFDVSADWLLTGEGEMLRKVEDRSNIVRIENAAAAKLPANSKLLPLVSQSAIAGFGGADFSIAEQDVKEYYVVPKFKYCTVDFMIEIYGASMYPKYNSGDIVACTVIKDSNFIQWNRCHIVGTMHQGILCKRLKPSDNKDCITAISDNPAYPPFDIPTSEITGIALICGVIRCE